MGGIGFEPTTSTIPHQFVLCAKLNLPVRQVWVGSALTVDDNDEVLLLRDDEFDFLPDCLLTHDNTLGQSLHLHDCWSKRAGKTTFATKFLPDFADCPEFLNADLIAAGLSPFSPQLQNFRASELMLERMQKLLDERKTFSFETTLAARSYARRIPKWQANGYQVFLFFLWLPSEELAIERVANRVRQGGHDIPIPSIRQRYQRGLSNFRSLYRPFVDGWLLLDGSQFPPIEVARQEEQSQVISDSMLWQQIEKQINN